MSRTNSPVRYGGDLHNALYSGNSALICKKVRLNVGELTYKGPGGRLVFRTVSLAETNGDDGCYKK